MVRQISKDEQLLLNTLYANLPSGVPYAEQQITEAVRIAKKYLSDKARKYDEDSIYIHSLRVAVDASAYAKALLKEAGNYASYRYDLIIIALLHDTIEDADCSELRKDLEIFRSGNNAILNGVLALTNDEAKIKEIGRSKYMSLKFSELTKTPDLFTIKLLDRVDNLSCIKLLLPRMDEEEVKLFIRSYLLESLVIYNNLCMADYSVNNESYKYWNEFVTMLLSDYKF